MASGVTPRGAQVIAWSYVTVSIAAIIVGLRFVVRAKIIHAIGKEDLCILISLICSLLCSVGMNLQVSKGGLGQHFDELTPEQIVNFQKGAYFAIISYNVSLVLTKFAILFLCLRVFTVAKWRTACYVVLGLIIPYTIWVVISSIVPCVPVRHQWDKTISGWCFPIAIVWFMNAGLNIFTDFLIVLLPIPAIISLQLPRKQKIGVGLVFALGFFVCIISIVRLYALHKGTTTLDPTYDNFAIAIWSVVEVNGAIIGACLPTLKPLISRVWPKLLSSGASRHHTYHQHSTGIDDTTAHTSKGTRARSRVASGTTPDFSSATEILGDDDIVVLTEIEVKSARIQTTADDCSSHEDTGQRRNSDAWVRN